MQHYIHFAYPNNKWEWPNDEAMATYGIHAPGWKDCSNKGWSRLRAENLKTGEVRYGSDWGLREDVWFATHQFPLRQQALKELCATM